ncbi:MULTISPECIES: DinB family protein [Pseudonocardia]|uniref:DinB superfamily protein n=2 Tax=Pseudonocardia TaxID=1847 RepID=A0A1Y2MWD0_PSEAH|nr:MULTISPECIES: DinB family protein [Pseudonocardia]OSY39279.1 DinB superfamily protein [Pseudonocardia autotrophica]TDN76499.1 uncharacterized protein DUF664 [Pseudonocardia autotrophica]BBG00499.1 hypothetical protein Pdca_17080 [Pseudonocardia autotrophica]GEC26459.1 hypothetical protein PSA01_34880 [Pseudonocardia saturnea]
MSTADSMSEVFAAVPAGLDGERRTLLETLAKHRMLLRHTVAELSDTDARRRPTASALTLAGLLKHVEGVERGWVDFILTGVVAGADEWEQAAESGAERDDFALDDADTLAALLDRYTATAARTDELVGTVDLDLSHPLPPAPWFPEEMHWSARQVFAHIIGETAQHSGHADIIRETIDGRRTMG